MNMNKMTRRIQTKTRYAFAIALCFFPVNVAPAASPLRIGSDKQLFIGPFDDDGRDTYLIETMTNVEMTMNPAHVTGERLVVQDKPWEGTGILDMRQFVLEDGGTFRMYYNALPHHFVSSDPNDPRKNLWGRPYNRILCYAESKDGIHWIKPNLGLCEWNASRENNILLPNDQFEYVFSEMDGPCVFIDPNAKTSDEKYKMFIKISPVRGKPEKNDEGPIPVRVTKQLGKAQYAFASPDGIRWRLMSSKKVNAGPKNDTAYSVFWDDRIGKYVQYSRVWEPAPEQVDYYKRTHEGYAGRTHIIEVGRATSDDFLNWSREQTVIKPDEIDRAGSPVGLVRMDFYGGNIGRYREAPNVYIGLPNAYYHWRFDLTRKWWTGKYIQEPSTMDVQLVLSRDGVHWHRTPRRRPFIRLGREGTFWSKTIWPDGTAIRVGDELWFYFAGLDVHHKEQSQKESRGARGRAVLRLDGFISADAAYTGGELTTRPLVFSGDRLQLNVDTSAGGTVFVEIQDEAGNPIEGFVAEDADEINGNYIRKLVTWNGSSYVGSLVDKPVRLRFVMRDTKLYSFQFLR
jgi:hypothetical protein